MVSWSMTLFGSMLLTVAVGEESDPQLVAVCGLEHESLEAWAVWEWRNEDGRRVGLRMLIVPAEALGELPPPILAA